MRVKRPPAICALTMTTGQSRTALEVLDSLDRMDRRLESFYSRSRKFERKAFRGLVTVIFPTACNPGTGDGAGEFEFKAWARNISQQGLSFIHPGRISATKMTIGIGEMEGMPAWFRVDVVRAREVENGFWEYGVAIRERIQR